jgi:S-DNA-T family DNA segregation ATPase FtsK/SpoIIIE
MELKPLLKSRRFNELVGLLLLFLGFITLLALMSYDASDPTWFHRQQEGATGSNWTGRVGATLAEALLQLVGVAAFLVPIVLGFVGWNRFRGRGMVASYGRFLGHVVLLLSLASLLELLYGWIEYGGDAFRAGGYLGWRLASVFRALFATPGAVALSALLVVASIILTTRFSFGNMIEIVYGRIRSAFTSFVTWARATIEDQRKAARKRAVLRKHDRNKAGASALKKAAATPPPPPRRSIPVPGEEPSATSDGPPAAPPIVPAEEPPEPPTPKPRQQDLFLEPSESGYSLPPLELLNEPVPQEIEDEQELLQRARKLTEKFHEFAVEGSVVAIHPGPVVTTFEFKPDAGVKYSKMTGMVDDLCLALKAESVRIDRLPGRSTVGIEVPNRRQEVIYPRDLFGAEAFSESPSKLTLALGKNINGEVFVSEMNRMPHLLIAGATGAGKSVALNGMIASVLYKATPTDVRFIMIDTKMIELGIYADIPHLLIPVVTDPKKASTALKWAVREMESRYRQLAAVGVRNIDQFNELLEEEPDRATAESADGEMVELRHLPFIVIVIDEMADLMMVTAADVEESIMRLAQMARAVGIHLLLATQRPSVDVITGTIKANFPSRIAFRVSQRVDSRTIIDQMGAEQLLGKGDMLFLPPGSARLTRLHGGYITEPELNRITAFLKKQAKPSYDDSVLKEPEEERGGYANGERDLMFVEAVRTVLQEGQCSITLIQRRLRLGYARAARIVDMMEQEGIVGPADGSKPREVMVGPEILETLEAAP